MTTEGHERKKGKNRLWGRMKGEPNERGQTDDSPNLIRENLLQKPSLLVNTPRARKEGAGGGRKEKEGEKEAKVFPATAQASKDTPKGRRALSYDESIQGRPRKRVKRGKTRRKERERERRGEERKEGVPSYEQSSRDTPKKERGDPEYFIQENPRKQGKKGGREGGGGGVKFSTGSNEP